jgi:hypothetical protein
MTDNARIPDHAAWAARGYWRNAYEALLKECKEQAALSPEPAPAAHANFTAAVNEKLRAEIGHLAAQHGITPAELIETAARGLAMAKGEPAPAAPATEPVAWRWRYLGSGWTVRQSPISAQEPRQGFVGIEVEPLYAHPADADLRAEVARLRAALTDMWAGWKYIRMTHGDLPGVGWDRCDAKARAALGEPRHG